MVIVKTIDEFYRKNEKELKKFMIDKTGIYDRDVINDTLQDFYVRLIETRALEKYDNTRAITEEENRKNFDRWICNNFCWLLPLLRRKNYTKVLKIKKSAKKRSEYWNTYPQEEDPNYDVLRFYSSIPNKRTQLIDSSVDIFDVVNPTSEDPYFGVHREYHLPQLDQHEEDENNDILQKFFKHVRKVKSPKRAQQIISYMKYKNDGLNGMDISIFLGVSNNMIKFIKEDALEMYEKWTKKITVA